MAAPPAIYGSGMVPITRMIRSGIVFDILGALTIALIVSFWAEIVGLY